MCERELWCSVIQTAAIDGYRRGQKGAPVVRLERAKAHDWFADNQRDFRLVCALAGLDPDFIRGAYMSGRLESMVTHRSGVSNMAAE